MTNNKSTSPVSFDVKNLYKANKSGYAVADVRFHGSKPNLYTYVRKYQIEGVDLNSILIDGCKVFFNDSYEVVSVRRVYDTKGKKKFASTVNFKGKSKSAKKSSNTSEDPKPADDAKKAEDEKDADKSTKPAGYVPLYPEVDLSKPVKHEKYQTIKTCLSCNIPVYLAGPAGSGKNFTVEQIADELGWDFYFSNSVQQEFKLTGFIDAAGDFHETEFYKACTSDRDCVFFLDEMDASIPEVLVLLNAAIANGYFEFPCGRVELEHVHFVAAGNTVGSGSDELYTGRMVIDQATLDRFAIIDFGYDAGIEMAMAENDDDLVDFVHSLRKSAERSGVRATFSYRCITMAKRLENAGMPLVDVVRIAVVKGLDRDTVNTLYVMCRHEDNRFAAALRDVKKAA